MLLAALVATAAGLAGAWELMQAQFAAGAALLAVSVLLLRWPRSIWTAPEADQPSAATRRLGVLVVCAVAAFFRLYQLNPPGLWGDDAINGLLAFDILDGKIASPFSLVSHSHSDFHALSNYPIAAAFWLFGPDLTTLRLPGILFGIAGAPLLYGIAARLFGHRVGLVAALFYASSPPQIAHAKSLIQVILGQFFMLLGLYLLVRGAQSGRRAALIAAGLPLALCVYTYHSARLAPLVGLAYGAALWWERRRTADVPARSGTGWSGALLVVGLTLLPAIIGYVRHPDALTGRVGATALWPIIREQGDLWPLWDAVWRTLLMFHYKQGPEYHWFGLGFDPAFNLVVGFLLVHGMVASLRGWRQPRHILLLIWVLIGLLPGFLSGGAPRLYRSLLATPPLYIWAALPIAALWNAAPRATPRGALRGLAVLLLAAVPLIDFNFYFYRVYSHPQYHWFQGERMVEMARTLRTYGPGWTGYLMSDTFSAGHESFRFLARSWQLDLRNVASLTEVLPLREQPDQGALFIMSQAALPAAEALRARYPGAALSLRREPTLRSWWLDDRWPLSEWHEPPRIVAAFYPVPRALAEHPAQGPPHHLVANYTLPGSSPSRSEPFPFYFFFPPTFPTPFDVMWRGHLTIPAPGGHRLDAETNGASTMWIDGRAVDLNQRIAAAHTPSPCRSATFPPPPAWPSTGPRRQATANWCRQRRGARRRVARRAAPR
ncbi:MAG: glycosyltransferase family 39 protein [Candidatus Binatia bacterium]